MTTATAAVFGLLAVFVGVLCGLLQPPPRRPPPPVSNETNARLANYLANKKTTPQNKTK